MQQALILGVQYGYLTSFKGSSYTAKSSVQDVNPRLCWQLRLFARPYRLFGEAFFISRGVVTRYWLQRLFSFHLFDRRTNVETLSNTCKYSHH